MIIIELISGSHCGLCETAKTQLIALQKQFGFAIREVKLKQDHPEYGKFKYDIPVIRHEWKILASGNTESVDLKSIIINLTNGKD